MSDKPILRQIAPDRYSVHCADTYLGEVWLREYEGPTGAKRMVWFAYGPDRKCVGNADGSYRDRAVALLVPGAA